MEHAQWRVLKDAREFVVWRWSGEGRLPGKKAMLQPWGPVSGWGVVRETAGQEGRGLTTHVLGFALQHDLPHH